MTLWRDFPLLELAQLGTAVCYECGYAAGVTLTGWRANDLETIFGVVIGHYRKAGVRCLYDPGDSEGIIAAGRPYMAAIAAIIRNTPDESFVPTYGRTTTSGTSSKTGTEQVSMKPTAGADLATRIEVAVPDIRAASVGSSETSDVDAAEKFRFDAEDEKSLYILFEKWVRRASVPEDL